MEEKKSKKKVAYVLMGTVGAIGLFGLGYWLIKGRKGVKVDEADDLFKKLSAGKDTDSNNAPATDATSQPKPTSSPKANTDKTTFPLRLRDKGTLVKHLQMSLLERYGADILPQFGADGEYGSELLAALKSKGFPEVITESAYKKLLAGEEWTEEDAAPTTESPSKPITKSKNLTTKQAIDVAKNIWLNSTLKKLPEMVAQLKKMHNTADYNTVNNLFKTIRTNGVHQTIVNATLSAFAGDDTSKHMITEQFIRMGLKYDGNKWSLSGFQPKQVMTNRMTYVRNLEGIELEVPAQTLLGEHLTERHHMTAFRTLDNHILYVPTKDISHV